MAASVPLLTTMVFLTTWVHGFTVHATKKLKPEFKEEEKVEEQYELLSADIT